MISPLVSLVVLIFSLLSVVGCDSLGDSTLHVADDATHRPGFSDVANPSSTEPLLLDPSPFDVLFADPLPADPFPAVPLTEDPLPIDTVPEDTVPEDAVPEDPVPEDPVPEDFVPEDPVPEDPVPEDPVPEDPVPEDSVSEDPLPVDQQTPISDAGPDLVFSVGDPQTLDGSASYDADGIITTYEWRLSGDLIATGIYPTLLPALSVGTYTIELKVIDEMDLSNTDTLSVVVQGASLEDHAHPFLQNTGFIETTPFAGTSESIEDSEGSARAGNSLWIADDESSTLWEVNLNTGMLMSSVDPSRLLATTEFSGTSTATANRVGDLEAMAFDPVADHLYAFNGTCCTRHPNLGTVFRLTRQPNSSFTPHSYNSLPPDSDFSGAAALPTTGEIWVGRDKTIIPYNYDTNTLGPGITFDLRGKIHGMGFSEDGNDLMIVTSSERLYRIDWETKSVAPGYPIRVPDVLDTRSIAVAGNEFLIGDGEGRPTSNPLSLAIHRFVQQSGTHAQADADRNDLTSYGVELSRPGIQ